MTQQDIHTEIFHMRAQLRSVDNKLKELASALTALAPAPAEESETTTEADSEHYRESDFYEEPTTPLELANRMRARKSTGEVWLAGFRTDENEMIYRAIYSHSAINPFHFLKSAEQRFRKPVYGLFLKVPTAPSPFIMYVKKASVWKSEDPIQILASFHEFEMQGLVELQNNVEVEG